MTTLSYARESLDELVKGIKENRREFEALSSKQAGDIWMDEVTKLREKFEEYRSQNNADPQNLPVDLQNLPADQDPPNLPADQDPPNLPTDPVEALRPRGHQLNGQVMALQPRGLQNYKNSCFLNVILQALLSCSPFLHILQELRTRNYSKDDYPTLTSFTEFIPKFDMPSGTNMKKKRSNVSFCPFRPAFGKVLKKFRKGGNESSYEDAEEFLQFVINQMDEEFLKLGQSKLSNIFKTKWRRSSGEGTLEEWLALQLSISSHDTIYDALEEFFALESKNLSVPAIRHSHIEKLPEIMILHLLRFDVMEKGPTKSYKHVKFPLELVLGDNLSISPTESKKYELVATITHYGEGVQAGHFLADCRRYPHDHWLRFDDGSAIETGNDDEWLRFNDSEVTSIKTNEVLSGLPSLLFYQKK